jgi:hypothetical protein
LLAGLFFHPDNGSSMSLGKSRVKVYHFQTPCSVQKTVTDAIKTLKEADFQSCYGAWKFRWAKSVASEGRYFEGDNVDLEE